MANLDLRYQPYLIDHSYLTDAITSIVFKTSDEALKFALNKGYTKEQIFISIIVL